MEDFINEEYLKLKDELSYSGRCNVINNIIQIKLCERSLTNFVQDISIDVKNYLNSLIDQAEYASIGYDSIEVKKVKELLLNFQLKDKLVYIDYFIRQLQKSSFENEIKNFQTLKVQSILKHCFLRKNIYKPRSIYDMLIYFPLLNLITLLATFIIMGFTISLILLPAPFDSMQLLNFKLNYENLNTNYFINHFLNTFGYFLAIDTDFKITPMNTVSMISYIIIKVVAVVYVGNVLFNKLNELLKN